MPKLTKKKFPPLSKLIKNAVGKFWKKIFDSEEFFYETSDGFDELTPEDYYNQLSYPLGWHVPPETTPETSLPDFPTRRERAERAFEMVLDTRKFEIEMYWRRATYFWAFIASAFVGYVALLNQEQYYPSFIVICIGFILSCAWHLSNIGSKTWQRHWEKHLDLLEDPFVGPLYKTINVTKTYSVSKINTIVSFVFCIVWLILGCHIIIKYNLICYSCHNPRIAWEFIFPIIGSLATIISMTLGYGRGKFGEQNAKMYRRKFYYHHK